MQPCSFISPHQRFLKFISLKNHFFSLFRGSESKSTIGSLHGFSSLHEIASGRDLKKFLSAIAGLWVLSILGGCCNFMTLAYIALVLLFTVPLVYNKYKDKIDPYGEKAMAELKKQYAVLDAKVLSKIPMGPLKDNKKD